MRRGRDPTGARRWVTIDQTRGAVVAEVRYRGNEGISSDDLENSVARHYQRGDLRFCWRWMVPRGT